MITKVCKILEDLGGVSEMIHPMEDGMFEQTQLLDRLLDLDLKRFSHAELEATWKYHNAPPIKKKTFSPGGLKTHMRMTHHAAKMGKEVP